jgi:predicted dehydrogenase/threonine dehydrogenase-like Zn-dependent dehydrogenase
MRQVLIKDGAVVLADVPAPGVGPRNILVRVAYSCISAGTEQASVRTSALPLYKRALRHPEHVRRVLDMVRDQGLRYTIERVRGLLDAGSPTGYSAAGTVVAVGAEVDGFRVGDRVACAGAGVANHAEFIDVPVNLAVRVPEGVALRDAATATLGAIALQGVRRAQPTLGETIVVVGLGLLGQLTAQLLRADGCRVLGVDPDAARRALAESLGTRVLDAGGAGYVEQVLRLTDGQGADAVIVTAASSSDEIMSEAMRSCRRKGRVVIVGDVGLHLRRSDFYAKEIDVLISSSYGPGRYDPNYEEGGQDYPLAYVRWTENRNMEAYLALLADGSVRLGPLGGKVFPLADAASCYAALRPGSAGTLLALIEYPTAGQDPSRVAARDRRSRPQPGRIRVAMIGAGGFAQGMHLPNLQKLRAHYELRAVVSRTGANAKAVAERYDAAYASTDVEAVLADPEVELVIIATRHDLHAQLAVKSLEAGKHVLVEKPLALDESSLASIERACARPAAAAAVLMTGFNRRFSPALQAARRALAGRTSPLIVDYRMNAGHLPASHWVHGPEGGGRNIGEACHIYDVFQYLTGSDWTGVKVAHAEPRSRHFRADDNFVATATYADGSVCTLTYTAMGARGYPKERMDIFCDGMVIALDDYRSLVITGRSARGWRSRAADKGQLQELQALASTLRDGSAWPITLEDQLAVMRLCFTVQDQLQTSNAAAT